MAEGSSPSKPTNESEFFTPIDPDAEVTEIESLCVNCYKQGVTKLMLTKIPFYRDVIVSSFECPHCHHRNTELAGAGEVSPTGIEWVLDVQDQLDLNRLIVKSDYATVSIPALEFETVPKTQKGELTTAEGILTRIIDALKQDQDRRQDESPELAEQITAFLKRVEDLLQLKSTFKIHIRDITGNSHIGTRPDVLHVTDDPHLTYTKFARTEAENEELGILPAQTGAEAVSQEEEKEKEEGIDHAEKFFASEVLKLDSKCPGCSAVCDVKMKVTDIPHFKEVIIMATNCERCGYRSNEVKSGGGIEPKGRRVKLEFVNKHDLKRGLIKSDTCSIEIPDMELHAGSGAIEGKFTTVEGILMDIKKHFADENPFIGGDSADPDLREKLGKVSAKLADFLTGEHCFTLVLDDPAGNCWIENFNDSEPDPHLIIEQYERTHDQNEELGINDMNVGDDGEQAKEDS